MKTFSRTQIYPAPIGITPPKDEVLQLRATLHRYQTQWSALFDRASIGMARVATNGYWLQVNQQFCSILGYSADELAHKPIQVLTHPDDQSRNSAAAQQLIAGETESYIATNRYFHKNGSIVWGRVTFSLARTMEAAPDYFIVVLEDITALKAAEEALRTSEERYRRIVNDQTDLICRFQPDLRLTFVNQAYSESAGKTSAELLGRSILELIPSEYQTQVIDHLAIQNSNGRAATMENPIKLADGLLHWFEWTDRAIVDAHGAIVEYQAVGRDITARRQAEAAERTQRQLAEALLYSLAALTTSLNVEQVMAQILASAATVVPSDAGSILLLEDGYYRIAYCRGFSPEVTTILQQQRFPIDTWTNTRNAFTNKSSYVVFDTQTAEEWGVFPLTAWIRSSIGVPIKRNGEVIGLLIADSTIPNYFNVADVDKLQTFAHYAGLALTNAYQAARLEQEVKARTVELQVAKDQIEAILNHSSDAILLVQPDLHIVQSNRIFALLFYNQPVAVQGQSLLDFIHPADRVMVKEGIALALTAGINNLQVRAYRSDGSQFDVELHISLMDDNGLVCTLRDITERKAHERQLRFYASFQESVNEAVITVDLDYKIQSWNKAAEAIYGWQAPEVIGRTTFDTLHTHYLGTTSSEEIKQLLFSQGYWQGEVIQHHKDGTPRNILDSLTLLRDIQQMPLGLVAISRDITEQRQIEIALEKSRHFAARITDTAPSIIYVYDLQAQRNVYINLNLTKVMGYSVEEFRALEQAFIREVMHPEDAVRFSAHIQQLLEGQDGEVFPFEYRMRHKNGDWHWFLGQDTIFQRADDGTVSQMLGVATDITVQKRATESLRTQRDFLQQLIDNVPAFISVKGRDGRYQLVNRLSAHIFNLTVAEMVGKTDAELNPNPAEVAFVRQKDQEVLTSGRSIFIPEQTILGTYYQTNKIPLKNADGEVDRLLIVSVDITTHKRAELALENALEAEKKLNKHRSGFITTTSHEFRTPLAAILSLTETLLAYRHRLTDDQILQRLLKVREQVDHMQTLMTDVLELERIQTRRMNFTPIELDLGAFCRELMDEFQSLFSVPQRLVYRGDEHVPVVKLDKRLLRHIVTNLLANAVKYSPNESTVTLTVAYTDEQLTLQVRDEGIGIPVDDIKHLFQPFQRASNVGTISGTGLGLAITKEAVMLHSGAITVESQLGIGTTFTVQIPVT